MKRDGLVILLAVALTALVVRTWFPRRVETVRPIPHIVTRVDTVRAVPPWFADSQRIWRRRRHTTDTLTLTTTVTLVDTVTIRVPVNAPPAERPNRWAIQSYHAGARFGDTAVVESFSIRTGQLGISRTFVPGILTALEWDSLPQPRFTFVPFPAPKGPGLWYTLKVGAIGFGSCSLLNLVMP